MSQYIPVDQFDQGVYVQQPVGFAPVQQPMQPVR